MSDRLCMRCMHTFDKRYDICPRCGTIVGAPPVKEHHIRPGTLLRGRYVLGYALRDDGNVLYIGYDCKYGSRVLIEECHDDPSTAGTSDESWIYHLSDSHPRPKASLSTRQAVVQRLIQLRQSYGIGYHLKCIHGNGSLYIVTEFIPGRSLEQFLCSLPNGRMALDTALPLFLKIAERVRRLHSAGIVHLHLDPQNIFYQSNGQIRILFLEQALEQDHLMRSHSPYAALEQYTITVRPTTGEWSDVYALAAIFYRMLTGKDIPEAFSRLENASIPSFSEAGIALHRGVEIAIINALKLDLMERTPTVDRFIQQLLSGVQSASMYAKDPFAKTDRHTQSRTGQQGTQAYSEQQDGQKTQTRNGQQDGQVILTRNGQPGGRQAQAHSGRASTQLCLGCMRHYKKTLYGSCPYCGYDIRSATTPHDCITPGTVVDGDYLLGRQIGRGAFGITYIGYDLSRGMRIAVKEYMPRDKAERNEDNSVQTLSPYDPRDLWEFDQGRQQVLEEATLLRGLVHVPEIVHVFDCLRANNTVYIVMEYLQGETLKTHLDRLGTLSVKEACLIILKVLQGLQAVHEDGLVHRDVAPDNIFLTKAGEVKLLDFGAARYAMLTAGQSSRIILKPFYAPLEQYSRAGCLGPWTDVYATAVTLYQMISGIVPPDARQRGQKDTVQSLSSLGVPIAPKLERAIMCAMAVSYRKRTPSANAFIHAIKEGMAQQDSMHFNTWKTDRPYRPPSPQENGSSTIRPTISWSSSADIPTQVYGDSFSQDIPTEVHND